MNWKKNSLTNIEEQMNMFWLGTEDEQDTPDPEPDLQVDAETGNFYFWLGSDGEDVKPTFMSRLQFEQMISDMDNGKTYS